MKGLKKKAEQNVRVSRFPVSLLLIYLACFLTLSGLHSGLIVLLSGLALPVWAKPVLVILYWFLASVGLTVFTRSQIKRVYEEPMVKLAEAASKVANGDFSVYISPLHTADRYDYLDVMIQDFNRMVEDLGSIETLKTDFFSNVSHEIKTPIAVIQNTATLLQNENLSPAQRQEHVETIISASRRLSSLITNILKLNKLEKQAISPAVCEYNLSAQLEDCALQFEAIWEKKEIEFEVEIEDDARLFADPELMELVWNNLLSNAFKFTPQGGTVVLRQRTDDAMIFVEVDDSGCGMDQETMSRIFDKFYQGDTSHATEGNGLGLALAQRVVTMMNGELSVLSTPGVGSVFTVRMPKAKTNNVLGKKMQRK